MSLVKFPVFELDFHILDLNYFKVILRGDFKHLMLVIAKAKHIKGIGAYVFVTAQSVELTGADVVYLYKLVLRNVLFLHRFEKLIISYPRKTTYHL